MNIKKSHIILITSLVAITTALSVYFINTHDEDIKASKNEPTKERPINSEKKDKVITMTLSALGDIMAHGPQLKAQYNPNNNSYSFSNNYNKIHSIINSTDLSLANLETTLIGSDYSGYPMFSTPDSIVDAIKGAGVDVLSLVNNHSADRGAKGLTRTVDVVRNSGLNTIGIKRDRSEKDYLVKDVAGFKLGMFAYSYGEIVDGREYLNGNPVPSDLTDLVNVFDTTTVDEALGPMKKQIQELKDIGVDSIILFIHWGQEYQTTPNTFQKELAQKLCDEGVDIIIGSHPHVVQPMEMIKSSNTSNPHETLVIYSLGNAISNQRQELMNSYYTEDGVIPIITLEKNVTKNITSIKKVEYIPTWVNRYYNTSLGKHSYEIVPITADTLKEESSISEDLTRSYKNTTGIIGNSHHIKPYL